MLRCVLSTIRDLFASAPTPSVPGLRRRPGVEGLEERAVLCAPCDVHPGCLLPPTTCCAPAQEAAPVANTTPVQQISPKPVLLVIANQDFYYREYSESRAALEAAGVPVVVAAASDSVCVPHWNSGQGADGGLVDPDLAVGDAEASDYSAIAFVGGWGASSYQYAFEGTYHNAAYNGEVAVRESVNDLINDFVDQDKYVAGLCHGVSVLAFARVDGVSPLSQVRATTYEGYAPSFDYAGHSVWNALTRNQLQANGAWTFAPNSIGDPSTAADDVWVHGKIITGQNYDSATHFGKILAHQVKM